MSYCKATTKDGKPCRGQAMANGYCYRHNPEISDAEKRRASGLRGGLAREQYVKQVETAKKVDIKSPSDILEVLNNNINDVRNGDIDPKTSNAIVQNVNAILKTYEVVIMEQRIRKLEESSGIDEPNSYGSLGGN